MVPAYRRRVAQILSSRHGGSEDAWMRAHDVAGAWYSDVLKEPETWSGVRSAVSVNASRAVVVDDRLDYLGAAATGEFVTLLLDREGRHSADAIPPSVRAILRNLAGLPHFVEVLDKGGDV